MSHSVLVVDDDPLVLMSIVRELRPSFDVLAAESVEKALSLLDLRPELAALVADFSLPAPGDGFELLKKVAERMPKTLRVLVSATLSPQEARPLISTRLIHHAIQKPWHPGDIANLLQLSLVTHPLGGGGKKKAK